MSLDVRKVAAGPGLIIDFQSRLTSTFRRLIRGLCRTSLPAEYAGKKVLFLVLL